MPRTLHRTTTDLPGWRLGVQNITRHPCTTAAELVASLVAVQAQDYAASKWALGLRLPEGAATDASVEDALDEGSVLRTHVFRSTWQLVAPADIRWLLALVAPRVISRSARRDRELELDDATFKKSNRTLRKAVRGGRHRTRAELGVALADAGIDPSEQRLPHLLARAELAGVLCSGARRGKQTTWALLDERAANARAPLVRDEALAELALRYFRSRGPATLEDLVWWSGLTTTELRGGLLSVASSLYREVLDGKEYWRSDEPVAPRGARGAYLLPAFDEYLVAYKDRAAVLDPQHGKRHNAGGGMLNPCVIVDGRVIGTWRRTLSRRSVRVDIDYFSTTPKGTMARDVKTAVARYGEFLELDVEA